MKNPKLESRNPKEARDLKSGNAAPSTTPLSHVSAAEGTLRRRFALPEQSRIWRTLITLSIQLFGAGVLFAQTYSIDWHTIDGGGGTSTGGVYSISGTIGQPDAGATMTGGGYSLNGGFWSAIAIQLPGSPPLSIASTSTNTLVVSWPSPSTGFILQSHSQIGMTNWAGFGGTVSDNGTNKFIIVNPPTGNRFYRLFRP